MTLVQPLKNQTSKRSPHSTLLVGGYAREPKAERQLSAFNGISAARTVALACADEPDIQLRICEEVLVTLIRRLNQAEEMDAAWRVALTLASRVKRRIAHALRLWRLDQPESIAEEVIAEIITMLYEAVFDSSQKSAFWEVRFWVAFDRRLLTIVRNRRIDMDRQVDLSYESDDGCDDERFDTIHALTAGNAHAGSVGLRDPLAGTLVAEALAQLPEAERTAYILKHVAGMPEDSSRKDCTDTIAGVLGVSGRTVRNYLRRAEQALSAWRSGEGQLAGKRGSSSVA